MSDFRLFPAIGSVGNPFRRPSGPEARAAIERWRQWLRDGDLNVIRCFYGFGNSDGGSKVKDEALSVGSRLDPGAITHEEWRSLISFIWQAGKDPKIGLHVNTVLAAVERGIRLGVEYSGSMVLPFKTWLILWEIDEEEALSLVGEAGYEEIVYEGASGIRRAIGERERWRAKDMSTVVWVMDQGGNPMARELVVQDLEDVKPLMLSKSKEARVLAIKLTQSFMAGDRKVTEVPRAIKT